MEFVNLVNNVPEIYRIITFQGKSCQAGAIITGGPVPETKSSGPRRAPPTCLSTGSGR
jgi:hypothetical protein